MRFSTARAYSATLLTTAALAGNAQSPVYTATYGDAVTGDNQYVSGGFNYWDVDAGADHYQDNCYERPTAQTYGMHGSKYSASEYFGFLDITQAKIGWDSTYLYVSIDMFSRNKVTTNGKQTEVGLLERYGFSFSSNADGRNGFLLVADQPDTNGTSFSRLKTFGYLDTDADVGGRGLVNGGPTGLSVTKSDNPLEEAGMNGYDDVIISDGEKKGGEDVLFSRIDPTDDTVVETAFKYISFGLTSTDIGNLQYFDVEANKGLKDPANYLWNDKYTGNEAGSPNAGAGGLSEFGTQGCGNIYELDTLCIGAVPEPSTFVALASCLGLGILARRRRK